MEAVSRRPGVTHYGVASAPEVVSGLWLVGLALYFVIAGLVLCLIVILFVVTHKDKAPGKTEEHQELHPPTQASWSIL